MSLTARHWGLRKPALLGRLQQDAGEYVLTQDLVSHTWPDKPPAFPEQAVHTLVRKLRKPGYPIDAKRGAGSPGYRIVAESVE